MSSAPRGHRPSRFAVVRYEFAGDFNEGPVEALLERARAAGVVVDYDGGRGHLKIELDPGRR